MPTPSPAPAPAALPPPRPPLVPVGQPAGRWELTFEDNFEGETLSAKNWTTGFGWGSYDGNSWTAACTSPNLVRVSGGLLTLSTALEPAPSAECAQSGKPYSAAAINSKATFAQEFGLFEARLRMPGRQGVVGAFWLHQRSGSSLPEIDIAEVIGQYPREVQMAVHHDDPAIRGNQAVGLRHRMGDLAAGFHVFAALWQPDLIQFYVDGEVVGQIDRQQGAGYYRGPAYLILNTMVCTSAVRGWCLAPTGTDPWDERTALQADWVRVWTLARREPR